MTIYFQGIGEQAHIFGDLGSPAKKLKNLTLKEKPSFCLTFFKRFLQLLGVAPQTHHWISQCIYFHANMLIWIDIDD